MKRRQKGFSLVELIIVIAIMAILIGVLTPQYLKYVEKSRRAKDDETVNQLMDLARVLATDEDYYLDINEGDYIYFDADNGITTGNTKIQNDFLPELMNGYQSMRIRSKAYHDQQFQVVFHLDTATDIRTAIQTGWVDI